MMPLRDQGQSEKYFHDEVGYNYRMEGIQGAVLGVKLTHLEAWTNARRQQAAAYQNELIDAAVQLLEPVADSDSAWHIFPVFTPRRDELAAYLKTREIGTGIHYPIPVHLQRAFVDLGYQAGDFPLTEQACTEVLSLPIYPELPREHLLRVAAAVREFSAGATSSAEVIRAHS